MCRLAGGRGIFKIIQTNKFTLTYSNNQDSLAESTMSADIDPSFLPAYFNRAVAHKNLGQWREVRTSACVRVLVCA